VEGGALHGPSVDSNETAAAFPAQTADFFAKSLCFARSMLQCGYSIARKDKTDHRFIRIELVLQVKRQDRQYQIKCEEQQKVGC